MTETTYNKIQARLHSIETDAEIHPSSAWFIVSLRLLMGGMILFAGLGKFEAISGSAFDASGYLANVHTASPVNGIYAAVASQAWLMDLVNVIIPITQVLIGLALIAGVFVRLAAFGGALQMIMFYLGSWEGAFLALFDYTLIYAVLFLALGAFAAGRIVGLDSYIEDSNIVKKYPKMKYLLG